MRARVDKSQAKTAFIEALSCKFGSIECARTIVSELVDGEVIEPTAARNYSIRSEYTRKLSERGVTPAIAVDSIAVKFDLDTSHVRQIIRRKGKYR